jgi:thioredoxin-related protein
LSPLTAAAAEERFEPAGFQPHGGPPLKRITCAAALLVLLAATNASAGPWHKTVAAAQKAAAEKKSYIFVDLWADWCGWCKKFEQEVVPAEAFQKATDDMILLRLNTEDGKEGTQFAQRYQATRLPMFLLLNADLTIAGVIRGYAPAEQFAAMVTRTVDTDKKFKQLVQKESKLGSDHASVLEIAKGFKERQNYAQSEVRLRKLTSTKGVAPAIRDSAFLELVMFYYEQGRYPEMQNAVNDFKKVQSTGEALEQSVIMVGNMYIQQGNVAAAVTEFRNFKKNYPKSTMIPKIDSVLPMLEQQIRK